MKHANFILLLVFFGGLSHASVEAASQPSFLRGLNLNGPAVTIDGHRWDGKNAKEYKCGDNAFEAQSVTLVPPTDADRTKMLRSSRWGGNRVELSAIPNGRCTVFLYVWEDNNPETYDISLNGREVERRYRSGPQGKWDRLGPWYVDVTDEKLVLTSQGGAANFSGIEVWQGEHDGHAQIPEDQLAFFEKRIRPLLVTKCYECHSQKADEVSANLLVDSAPTIRRGGDSGAAVLPGDPDKSLLIEAVRYENRDMEMPPDEKLSTAEIRDLEKWVSMGAPDPRHDATKIPRRTIDVAKAREFWSFRPIENPAAPKVQDPDWPLSDIDRFILAKLEQQKLKPVGMADKRTLIRRATYDLTGLPPSPEDIRAFLEDDSSEAFSRVVDRLLDSQQYGERWGRHWMDLVRYADTAGENSDYPIPQAYLYRNYIINAFNDDKPYDEFVREQIAGDQLPAANDEQRNEQTIATGYIAISRRFGSVIKNYPQHLTIEDTIDNVGRVFQGLTLSCSRCHDHKFDPILQTDYYAMYGIFDSTQYPFPGIELDKKPRDFVPLLENGKPGKSLAYAVSESRAADAALQVRGEPTKPGEIVPRGFPELLGGQSLSGSESKQSGRRQLADWLTDRDNPLTARVMANRIWQYHFGSGLVTTPSDFGHRGQSPSHPELLDWLAARFMSDGWSIKSMHRLIMNSRVYQLDSKSTSDSQALAVDPTNQLRWRFSRQRLDAESLRDTLLLLSKELDTSMMKEPHPFPPVDKWQFTQHHPFRDSYESKRRSVYLMTARLNARPFFTTFGGADRNASTATRDSSVTSVQSLFLMNNDFIHQQAAQFADRLLKKTSSDSDRVRLAFELVVGRFPTAAEQSTVDNYLKQLRRELGTEESKESDVEHELWTSFARSMFRMNEFLYVD
ncbi:Planctomycete cytochrome C [Thalassoglobus neptunius]|uniref:Planctomycete cytochrome C n=1 Tax=Thalassoglobus neptunius TaxID=1938619 RepID=A0A5C5VBK6_9PLAN|nr:PSD1 and planctomycete cytochrome C domain-containing protein [Thalassoglobus neptunius]TWT35092.1 Planctomycete cytochrome C [Thalassoglobus neptunius]